MSRRYPGLWRILNVALLAGLAVTIIATVRQYGITWDEPSHREYGDCILYWYSSGFHDTKVLELGNLSLYGGFFDFLAQGVAHMSFLDTYTTRHLVNAAFGLLAVIYAERLGTLLGGPKTGFAAAVSLTLMPIFYGHMFNNPKDIPFAGLNAAALFYMVQCVRMLPQVSKRNLLKLGIAIGLAMGVRIGGGILLGLWAGCLGVYLLTTAGTASPKAFVHAALRLAGSFAAVLVVAWCAMLIGWPWGQGSPIRGPWEVLQLISKFPWEGLVLFNGVQIPSDRLPWFYVPTLLAYTLPEFVIVGCMLGAGMAAVRLRQITLAKSWPYLLLGVETGVPIAIAIGMHSTLYDGIRHFLFVMPPLAVLAAAGVTAFLESGAPRGAKWLGAALLLLGCCCTAVDMVELHPYQSVYFNRAIAGGLRHAASRFETDFWGVSYKEASEWVIANYERSYLGRIRVATFPIDMFAHHYFEGNQQDRRRFAVVGHDQLPNVYLSITRFGGNSRHPGKALHIIRRQGTPLCYVIETYPLEPAPANATVTAATGPLPEGACRALLTMDEPPAAMDHQATVVITVRLQNRGNALWPAMEATGGKDCRVDVGNHWLLADGMMKQQDDGRGYLAYDLKPGETGTVTMPVRAPAEPGDYVLEIDVLQEDVAWFGQRTGSPTLRVPIHVK